MSVDICVAFRRASARKDCGGLDVALLDETERLIQAACTNVDDGGYYPFRVFDSQGGFEIYADDATHDGTVGKWAPRPLEGVRVVTFCTRSIEELQFATIASLALACHADGVWFDPQGEKVISGVRLCELLEDALRVARGGQSFETFRCE